MNDADVARIEQRLADTAAAVDSLTRCLDEIRIATSEMKSKQAATEAILQNGISRLIKETHTQLIEHVSREDMQTKIAADERDRLLAGYTSISAQMSQMHSRTVTMLLTSSGFVMTVMLGVIGYLFHLNFGQQ